MANPIASLFVEFRASLDKLHDDLGAVSKEFRAFDKDMKPVTDRINEFGKAATQAGILLTAAVTAPIAAIAGVGIQFNAMQEQAQIAFTTMLGSGGQAKAFLDDLKNFAAKTPFEFPDLVRAAQRLMAMGFAASDVKPTLVAVGNAVAGLGGGEAEINRVTLAIGQMAGRGKVATQEMNQLTEVGIPAWKMLVDAGIAPTEAALRAMVEKGVVPADVAVKALIDGMNTRFPNMMEQQSTTFNGLMSTIKDEARFMAGELTEGLFGLVKGPLESFANGLHAIRESMDGWSDGTKATIAIIAGLAAAIGPILLGLGGLALGVNQIITLGGHLSLVLTPLLGEAGFAGLGTAITSVAGALAGPLAIAIGAISLGALAIEALGLHDAFYGLVAQVWEFGKAAAALGFESLKMALRGIRDEVAALYDIAQPVIEAISWMLKLAGTTLGRNLENTAAGLKSVTGALNDMTSASKLGPSASLGDYGPKLGAALGDYGPRLEDAHKKQININTSSAVLTAELKKQEDQWIKNRAEMYLIELSIRRMNEAYDKPAPPMPMPIGTSLPDTGLQSIARGIGVPELPTLPKVGLPVVLGPTPQASTDVWDKYKKEGQKAIDQIVGDMSRMFVDGIVHGKNLWESFKNVGQNAVAGIIDTLMTKMLHAFLDPFSTALGQLLNGVTSGLTSAFSGFGKSISGLFGGGGASAATGAASSVGGGTSSLGGLASGGGLMSLAGGALGGAISAIGTMRLEGTMNAVEANTRFAAIHLGVMINDFFWPMRTHTEWIMNHAETHTNQLDAIYNVLSGRGPAGGGGVASAAVGNNITLNVNVTAPKGSDAATWGDTLISRINEALITDRGGLRTNIALVATQTNGIVSTVPAT